MANRLSATLRRSFVSGIVLVAPLLITLFVLNLAFGWITTAVDPIVQQTQLTRYTGNSRQVAQLLAVVLLLGTVTVLGYVAQRGFGRRVFGGMGRAMNFLPMVSVIYGSARQVADSLIERDSRYREVVLVEYPRDGTYLIGLATGEAPPAVETAIDTEARMIYLPNSPNPTGGRLAVVPEGRLIETELSVRKAFRTMITTGIGEQPEAYAGELPDSVARSADRPDAVARDDGT